MVGSMYVSDPEVWKNFFRDLRDGKIDHRRYRGRQTGGAGIAGMYAKKSYLIPVPSYEREKIVVGQQVTPVAAALERAKSELKDAIRDDRPHVPIKEKKPRKTTSSTGTSKGATSKRKREEEANVFQKRRK